jgi:hypothetical protein
MKMSIKNRYFSRVPSIKYIFKNGKEAAFIGGVFDTDFESEIVELDAEIKSGHPHIFTDASQLTVDSEQVDPIEEIKKRAIAEYLASVKAVSDVTNDRGTTVQEPVKPTSTLDVAEASADSSSGASTPVAAPSAPVGMVKAAK